MEWIACALVARSELAPSDGVSPLAAGLVQYLSWPPIGLLISLEPGSDDIA